MLVALYRHLWCSWLNRRRQRLFRNISLLYLVETRLNLTIIQIKRQERSYYRLLKVWKMRFTSYSPALDMLTLPLVSLSKPGGPFNLRCISRRLIFFKEHFGRFPCIIARGGLFAFTPQPYSHKANKVCRVITTIPNAVAKDTPKSIPKKVLSGCCHPLNLKRKSIQKLQNQFLWSSES